MRSKLLRILQQEDINFLLTNRIPRASLTRFMGWFSRIEQPLIRRLSIATWRAFSDLDLSEARKQTFSSMHDCFTRELKPGARPIDPDPGVMTSPCDAMVGACGRLDGTRILQAKGFPYTLLDLLGDPELVERYQDAAYATLRITASMYHRFHAPHDLRVDRVVYVSGDTWNVNPIALRRIERLFCKNERAIVSTRLAPSDHRVTLVAVAAILVASIRLHCLDVLLNLRHRGPNVIACDASYRKGEELGWFEHGSTIIVFAPEGFSLCDNIREGAMVRVGEPLMRIP